MHHNYYTCALEPGGLQLRSPHATATEAHAPRTRAPQDQPPQWEARAPQLEGSPSLAMKTQHSQK